VAAAEAMAVLLAAKRPRKRRKKRRKRKKRWTSEVVWICSAAEERIIRLRKVVSDLHTDGCSSYSSLLVVLLALSN